MPLVLGIPSSLRLGVLAVRCRFFGNSFWRMSGDAPYLRDFHETLSRDLEIALFTVDRVAVKPLAAPTAEAFWSWGFDFRQWGTTLCDTAMLLRKGS
jgi:hypothetical protein